MGCVVDCGGGFVVGVGGEVEMCQVVGVVSFLGKLYCLVIVFVVLCVLGEVVGVKVVCYQGCGDGFLYGQYCWVVGQDWVCCGCQFGCV